VQHPTFQQFWLVYKIAAKALRVVFAVPKISATCIYFFHSVNPFDLTKLSPPSRFLVTQLSLSEKRIARLGASIFDKLASTILELAPSLAIDAHTIFIFKDHISIPSLLTIISPDAIMDAEFNP
jgi:hypothetical protein